MSPPAGSARAEPGRPLRLVAQSVPKGERQALSGDGVLVRCPADATWSPRTGVRLVPERPVSALTVAFLAWSGAKLAAAGKRVRRLIRDNAGWHVSHAVRRWVRAHNRRVRRHGRGVRILVCRLPSRSPWLNPIEPQWRHGKQAVAEPDGLISGAEPERRVYAHFACEPEPHLTVTEKVA